MGLSRDVVSAALVCSSALLGGAWTLIADFLREGLVHFLDRKERGCPNANQSGGSYGRCEASSRDVVGEIGDEHDVVLPEAVMHALQFPAGALEAGPYGGPAA